MAVSSIARALLLIVAARLVYAAPADLTSYNDLEARAVNPYTPVRTTCPSGPLTRPATGISSSEATYVSARKKKSDVALQAWLAKTSKDFGKPKDYPTIGLVSSGGGFRALLTSAGVHQALDSRDGQTSVSGLYQAMTYESGLSGGAWLLGSITGNNWPTITSLKQNLWERTFANSLLVPNGPAAPVAYAEITAAVKSKQLAGFDPTIVDVYGRLLGYALLEQAMGGVADTFSMMTTQSNFTSHAVPYPITTALGVDGANGQTVPTLNATQYEFSPYDFGSWDPGVASFISTHYLGSTSSTPADACITRYDNTGYIMGTSSDVFNAFAGALDSMSIPAPLRDVFTKAVGRAPVTRDVYATYPNPFRNPQTSALVASTKELTLVDGGEALSNDPIWPFLHRPSVSALLVSDNSADTDANFPNGSEIHSTYVQAQMKGLTRMPAIPTADVFVAQGYDKRPVFFGCNNKDVITIIFIPNAAYSYSSGQSTFKLQYSKAETDGMIANGVQVGSVGGDKGWGLCVGCAVMKKAGGALPSGCTACFTKYCYN